MPALLLPADVMSEQAAKLSNGCRALQNGSCRQPRCASQGGSHGVAWSAALESTEVVVVAAERVARDCVAGGA